MYIFNIKGLPIEEIKVDVHGDWLPRQFMGMFYLIFATLRSFYLAIWLFFFCSFHYDVIIVDQIPFTIPILKCCADGVLFYCHFPDKFLAPKSKNPLRKLAYRYWFDWLEAATIVMADKILVNSLFTVNKFMEAFPTAKRRPAILYPGVNVNNVNNVNISHPIHDDQQFPWPQYTH